MHLLIYIPCWVNYAEGWQQVLRLRNQHAELKTRGMNLELEFSISVNAVSNIHPTYVDHFSTLGGTFRHHEAVLGDVNINLGFLDASRSNADLFWIVSPGDKVSDTALENIVNFFERNAKLDFIVADEEDRGIRDVHFKWSELDFRVLSEASFGMVTGLIYRLQAFRPFLHHGLQASFTGWGQLAVFLGATHSPNGIRGRIFPSDYFYFRGDSKILSHDSKVENMRNYAHSFFGFVVLISLISPTPNAEVRRWVRSNFFRIGAYHRAYSKPTNDYVRLTDLRKMAHMIVRNTDFLTRTLFFLSSKVDFTSLKRILDHAR
jgi:hypothetical protein